MKELYVGDWAAKKKRGIMRRIRKRRLLAGVYVLTISTNPSNQIDIFTANQLRMSYYRNQKELTIVGIALGYEEALLLLMRIADECVRRTGGGDLRRFLLDKMAADGES